MTSFTQCPQPSGTLRQSPLVRTDPTLARSATWSSRVQVVWLPSSTIQPCLHTLVSKCISYNLIAENPQRFWVGKNYGFYGKVFTSSIVHHMMPHWAMAPAEWSWLFAGQLVSYEVVHASSSACPVELMKIPIPAKDHDFMINHTGPQYLPFVRSKYNPQSGQSPGNPRKAVSDNFCAEQLLPVHTQGCVLPKLSSHPKQGQQGHQLDWWQLHVWLRKGLVQLLTCFCWWTPPGSEW